MAFRQKLAKATGIRESLLPTGYQIVGDVLLLKLPKIKLPEQKKKIAAACASLLPYVKTVCEIKEVKGDLREPVIQKLIGNTTVTTHKENDILFKIDLSQLMFSKGNLLERKRLIKQVGENEVIIDMFAGIGYFSLGIAKFTKANEIIAIEKNPVAYNFLTDNIALNKLTNMNAINGDCRQFAGSFENTADRIIMGYFPGTTEFLPYALFMAKNGCIIHFHNIYGKKDLWKKPLIEIKTAAEKARVKFKIITKRKVKSYSPNTWHIVIDFSVSKE